MPRRARPFHDQATLRRPRRHPETSIDSSSSTTRRKTPRNSRGRRCRLPRPGAVTTALYTLEPTVQSGAPDRLEAPRPGRILRSRKALSSMAPSTVSSGSSIPYDRQGVQPGPQIGQGRRSKRQAPTREVSSSPLPPCRVRQVQQVETESSSERARHPASSTSMGPTMCDLVHGVRLDRARQVGRSRRCAAAQTTVERWVLPEPAGPTSANAPPRQSGQRSRVHEG